MKKWENQWSLKNKNQQTSNIRHEMTEWLNQFIFIYCLWGQPMCDDNLNIVVSKLNASVRRVNRKLSKHCITNQSANWNTIFLHREREKEQHCGQSRTSKDASINHAICQCTANMWYECMCEVMNQVELQTWRPTKLTAEDDRALLWGRGRTLALKEKTFTHTVASRQRPCLAEQTRK